MSPRDKLIKARELINAKQYDEARSLLETVDHPKAVEWLEKLDAVQQRVSAKVPEKVKRVEPEAPAAPVVQVNVVQQAAAGPAIVIRDKGEQGPGCLVQFLWFVTIGWWLSELAIAAGYLLVATVLFMPFGFMLLNKVPYLATLRSFSKEMAVTQEGGIIQIEQKGLKQRSTLLRVIYFLLIGWWFGFIVLELAWLFTASFLLAPVGLRLFAWSPTALTLRR